MEGQDTNTRAPDAQMTSIRHHDAHPELPALLAGPLAHAATESGDDVRPRWLDGNRVDSVRGWAASTKGGVRACLLTVCVCALALVLVLCRGCCWWWRLLTARARRFSQSPDDHAQRRGRTTTSDPRSDAARHTDRRAVLLTGQWNRVRRRRRPWSASRATPRRPPEEQNLNWTWPEQRGLAGREGEGRDSTGEASDIAA
jgi:hypothetical protein